MTLSPDTVLQLRGVGMRYDDGPEVLHDIDLVIDSGSFHYITGPSGAGKTSLLRLIGLACPPSRGTLTLFGQDTDRIDRQQLAGLRRRIGVVFQDFRLLNHLSVFDNVALPLRIAGLEEAEISRLVTDLLAWLGLESIIEAKPAKLSMGQQQLVATARAVVARPQILLADEPTSNVDRDRGERLMTLFAQMRRLGTAVLIATHSADLLERHPFPALEMREGRLAPPPRHASSLDR